jgi:hypothetical protein
MFNEWRPDPLASDLLRGVIRFWPSRPTSSQRSGHSEFRSDSHNWLRASFRTNSNESAGRKYAILRDFFSRRRPASSAEFGGIR